MSGIQAGAKARVWDGAELPSGTPVAFRGSRYCTVGPPTWGCFNFTHSAGMLLTPFRFDASEPFEDFLMVDESTAGLGEVFTIETWPKAQGEYFLRPTYTKCILRAKNGKYLEPNGGGAMKASADQDGARVFCLTVDPEYGPMIVDPMYVYSQRAQLDPLLGTLFQQGTYTLVPQGAPPGVPLMLTSIQGVESVEIIVVDEE